MQRAVLLLWASLAITILDTMASEIREPSESTVWGLYLVMYGGWALIIAAISRRRKWARIAASFFIVVSWAFLFWPEARAGLTWWEQGSWVLSLILDTVAMVLLFSSQGNHWYNRTADGRAF